MSKKCEDKACNSTISFQSYCKQYVGNNCQFPCSTENCSVVILEESDCIEWICSDFASDSNSNVEIGIVTGAVVIVCLALIVLLVWKRRTQRNSDQIPNEGQNEEVVPEERSCLEKLFCRKPRVNDGPPNEQRIGESPNQDEGSCFQRFSIYCMSCNELIENRRHYNDPNSFSMNCFSGRNEEQYRPITSDFERHENQQLHLETSQQS